MEQAIYVKGSLPIPYHESRFFLFDGLVQSSSCDWPILKIKLVLTIK